MKDVSRQLLRVFAHLYHAHYPQILHLRSEGHFNSLFAHFLAFGKEYELLDPKDIKGQPGALVGVGALWEKWKEMGAKVGLREWDVKQAVEASLGSGSVNTKQDVQEQALVGETGGNGTAS